LISECKKAAKSSASRTNTGVKKYGLIKKVVRTQTGDLLGACMDDATDKAARKNCMVEAETGMKDFGVDKKEQSSVLRRAKNDIVKSVFEKMYQGTNKTIAEIKAEAKQTYIDLNPDLEKTVAEKRFKKEVNKVRAKIMREVLNSRDKKMNSTEEKSAVDNCVKVGGKELNCKAQLIRQRSNILATTLSDCVSEGGTKADCIKESIKDTEKLNEKAGTCTSCQIYVKIIAMRKAKMDDCINYDNKTKADCKIQVEASLPNVDKPTKKIRYKCKTTLVLAGTKATTKSEQLKIPLQTLINSEKKITLDK